MATADWAEADSDIYLPLRFGDPGALEVAYNRYGGLAYGLSLRIVSDAGDAEEVVQEVFLRVWKSPYSFDPSRGSFRTWLLTLVRNPSIDRLRAPHRLPPGAELPAHLEAHPSHSHPWQPPARGPAAAAVRNGRAAPPSE